MDDHALKRELALGYRVLGLNGLGLGMLAHLTVRRPGGSTYFTYQLGLSVEEVRIGDIVEVDFALNVVGQEAEINPSLSIHGDIYSARPDVVCITHHHGDNGVALGALGGHLVPFDRNSARWVGDITVAGDYESLPLFEQGPAIVSALGQKKALFLKHHGMLVTGECVPDVVVATVELEKSCKVLLKTLAAGTPELLGPTEIADSKKILSSARFYNYTWAYYLRVLARNGLDADVDQVDSIRQIVA
jgi:L-fuculose-phosphate aldolase